MFVAVVVLKGVFFHKKKKSKTAGYENENLVFLLPWHGVSNKKKFLLKNVHNLFAFASKFVYEIHLSNGFLRNWVNIFKFIKIKVKKKENIKNKN